jgi:hypothetical protein
LNHNNAKPISKAAIPGLSKCCTIEKERANISVDVVQIKDAAAKNPKTVLRAAPWIPRIGINTNYR